MNKKVKILGGRGMLGTDLTEACQRNGMAVEALDLPEFDITDETQLEQAVKDSAVIINCAAYTNVEKAESESELAYKINAEAPGTLGVLAKQAAVPVLHISTDFVFDGKLDRPYVETDAAGPINTYGKSKIDGEKLLIQSGCDLCILRIEWTYGRAGNNFVKKLIATAKSRKNLRVVDDQAGSPTATTEVAGVICKLLADLPGGIFHFAAAGETNRYEMAKFIFETLGMDVGLTPCKTFDYPCAAARPLNSRFNCGKIQALLGEPIRHWKEPLKKFLEQL